MLYFSLSINISTKIKIMKALCILFVFSLTAFISLKAQNGADFVLTKSNEKISGEIFQPNNFLKEVQLKKTGEDNFITYAAADIKGYEYKQVYYASCDIKEEGGSLFLIEAVSGTANLYSFPINHKYYIEKNGTFYVIEKNDRVINGKFMEDRRFIGVLRVLFNDCNTIVDKLEKVKFSTESLTQITQTYNTCRDPNLIYQKAAKPAGNVKIAAYAGAAFNKGKLSNVSYSSFKYADYSGGYTAGIRFRLNTFIVPNLYVIPGIGITNKKAGLTEFYSLDNIRSTIDYTCIQAPLKLSYIFSSKEAAPYLTAGVIFSFSLKNETVTQQLYASTQTVVVEDKRHLDNLYESGALVGFGFQFNQLKKMLPFLEYQLEKTWLANSGRWTFTTQSILLGVHF
jgi:hypothetical protein